MINSTMDAIKNVYKNMNKLSMVLGLALLSVLVCIMLLILSYVKLQTSHPLENVHYEDAIKNPTDLKKA